MFTEYWIVLKRHLGLFVGGASVSALGFVFSFLAWKFQNDPTLSEYTAFASLGVLILSVLPAQYGAWKEERLEREKAEALLYRDADLKGTMIVEIGGHSPYQDKAISGCFFRVSIDASNTGRQECSIGSIHIWVKLAEGQVIEFAPSFGIPIEINPVNVKAGDYFRFQSEVINQPAVSPAALRGSMISVSLVDGEKRIHKFIETKISPRILEMGSVLRALTEGRSFDHSL